MLGAQLVPTPTRASSGAGRTMSFEYPNFISSDLNNSNGITRGGVIQGVSVTSSGTGSRNAYSINGVDCEVFQTLAAADLSAVFLDALPIRLNTTIGNFIGNANPVQCWRTVVNMAVPAGQVVANNRDFGYQVVSQSALSGSIFGNNLAGWGITIRDQNSFDFVVNGPNGVQRVNFAGVDTTKFHSYEFRMIGATQLASARLSLLLDGVRLSLPDVFSLWSAAGSNLQPSTVFAGGRVGFVTRLMNNCGIGGSGQLFVANAGVYAAPTELDLL